MCWRLAARIRADLGSKASKCNSGRAAHGGGGGGGLLGPAYFLLAARNQPPSAPQMYINVNPSSLADVKEALESNYFLFKLIN